MKLVIDSSVFVAAFREEEPHSREAFRILEKLENETMGAVILPMITLDQEMAEVARQYVEVLEIGSF